MGEEPAADNEIVGRVKFEEERLTWTQATKLSLSTRLPEINFIDSWLLGQEREPVIVSDADETPHLAHLFYRRLGSSIQVLGPRIQDPASTLCIFLGTSFCFFDRVFRFVECQLF